VKVQRALFRDRGQRASRNTHAFSSMPLTSANTPYFGM